MSLFPPEHHLSRVAGRHACSLVAIPLTRLSVGSAPIIRYPPYRLAQVAGCCPSLSWGSILKSPGRDDQGSPDMHWGKDLNSLAGCRQRFGVRRPVAAFPSPRSGFLFLETYRRGARKSGCAAGESCDKSQQSKGTKSRRLRNTSRKNLAGFMSLACWKRYSSDNLWAGGLGQDRELNSSSSFVSAGCFARQVNHVRSQECRCGQSSCTRSCW